MAPIRYVSATRQRGSIVHPADDQERSRRKVDLPCLRCGLICDATASGFRHSSFDIRVSRRRPAAPRHPAEIDQLVDV
ncbi:MAG: hypothetical protein WD069_05745, partial [Planctomycetales bacterium]